MRLPTIDSRRPLLPAKWGAALARARNFFIGREAAMKPELPPGMTNEHVDRMRTAIAGGNEAEARRIVESLGLTWSDGRVETSQIEGPSTPVPVRGIPL
jgi:hypothetical protein